LLKKIGISLGLVQLGSWISQSKLMVKRQIRVPFHDPDTQDDSVWERRLADYAMARQSADVMKASAFFDARPHLPLIAHPVCIVWGLNDSVVPHAHAERIASLVSRVEIHKLAECGHLPMLEQPSSFLKIAQTFFASE
jgi:pimeloyl-ACP methyl ester carboxylesterase